jgi:hypothetical protein
MFLLMNFTFLANIQIAAAVRRMNKICCANCIIDANLSAVKIGAKNGIGKKQGMCTGERINKKKTQTHGTGSGGAEQR